MGPTDRAEGLRDAPACGELAGRADVGGQRGPRVGRCSTRRWVCVCLSLYLPLCVCSLAEVGPSPWLRALDGGRDRDRGRGKGKGKGRGKRRARQKEGRLREGQKDTGWCRPAGDEVRVPWGISRADHIAHVCASVGGLRSNAPRSGPSRIDQLPSASSPPAPAPPRLSVPTHHRSPSLFTTAAASHPPWTTSTPRPSRLSLAWYVMAPIVYSRRPS